MQKKYSNSVQVFYQRFDRKELIRIIKDRLDKLKGELPISLIVLFGSYAKDSYTTASDIDLLVVYEGQKREDAYAKVKKTIEISGIEPHIYTESEYTKMKEVIEKMIKNGVILFSKWVILVIVSRIHLVEINNVIDNLAGKEEFVKLFW